VDYIAVEEVNAHVLEEIAIGLCNGAKLAGISISGGETAQLKDMIKGFDLAGAAIGYVPLDKILQGQDIHQGDVLIGIKSNGIHSNGLSLARRAFQGHRLSARFDELNSDLGTELLRPTHIYVGEALELIARLKSLKALMHITGDGFLNLTRVKADVGYVIDALPDIPPIFPLVQRFGQVDDTEMFSVFNMGIGFCAVVAESEVDLALSILSSKGKSAHRIGYAVSDPERNVRLLKQRLVGRGKRFVRAE
jgi:phosphoribosylformylglycinamidine cyclo-ligase